MPLQTEPSKFVQFQYKPDYLQSREYLPTQSDPNEICESISIVTQKSHLIVDGGNIIKGATWAILTDKIFKENPNHSRNEIVDELTKLLNVTPIIIPTLPYDWTGHADGVLRYYNNKTVLINDFSGSFIQYRRKVESILSKLGINTIPIPFAPEVDGNISASGYYINYLQLKNHILIPEFGIPEDVIALEKFQLLFPDYTVIPIPSKAIASQGGVLNCISWNILK
ncbi:MAG: agmatine deiminase family protein [Bacteroidia bacterium]|nr:agmatine deiminase family protein [Bacteroidia bacterium]